MLLALVLLATSSPSPTERVALAELCHRSDVIAIVRVGDSPPANVQGAFRFESRVDLEVLTLLKGQLSNPLTVRFQTTVCPAPPRYPAGATEIVFLCMYDDGHYRTVGLSSGTIFPAKAEFAFFEARIRELLLIQAELEDAWYTSDAFIEWSVRCLEQHATRFAGIHALSGGTKLTWRSSEERVSLYNRIDQSQRERILEAFRRTDKIEYVDLGLLKVLRDWDDPRVDEAALNFIADKQHTRNSIDSYTIRFLAERWEDERIPKFLDGFTILWRLHRTNHAQRCDLMVDVFLTYVNQS